MEIKEDDICPICGERYSRLFSEDEVDTYSCKKDKYTLIGNEWRSIKSKPKKQQIRLLKDILEQRLEGQKELHKGFLDEYEKDMPGITTEMKDKVIRSSGQIIKNYEVLLKQFSL